MRDEAVVVASDVLPVEGGTGLVLPTGREPLRRLRTLQRAEAWRLLKLLGARGDRRIATKLADLARRDVGAAVALLTEPRAAVLARCGRLRDAGLAWEVLLTKGLDAREGLVPLRAGLHLALIDPNPLALLEAHPEKAGNALSLGGRDAREWTEAIDAALALVGEHLPLVLEEMRALGTLIVPVGYETERHLSASYREYVGAIYLTLHPDVRTLAEALVHEHQHNKANLASHHDALLHDALGTLVPSPVRPDLRPLWGVLLAVHAFVPVAELFRRAREAGQGHDARLADVIARNDEGLRTLRAYARPTRIGAALLEELERLHASHLALGLRGPSDVAWEG